MAEGRIATFGSDGAYRRCIEAKLTWPTADKYIAVSGRRLLLGDYRLDYPWVFAAQRQGAAPGRFQNPAMAVQDVGGRIYVADQGNDRIQVFRASHHDEPECVIKTPGGPLAVDVRGPWMAVLTDHNTLAVLRMTDESGQPVATLDVGSGGHSVAIGPESTFS